LQVEIAFILQRAGAVSPQLQAMFLMRQLACCRLSDSDLRPVPLIERSEKKGPIMYSMLPGDAMAGAMEMVCYSFTVVAALVSCLLSLRF
jgi:hypothetical protein